jgi:DNA-binding transcriptional LysR family regulator
MTSIERVAHRLKLRDLRLFDAVVRSKSMAKAAAHLNLTQPAVSRAISELEHTLGVRLLDRSRQGVEPTAHGQALIKRGIVIFDELRQGVSEFESLSDPTTGEVRVAASVMMAAGILPVIVDRISRRFPRISIIARETPIGLLELHALPYRELRERAVDLVLGPIVGPPAAEDLDIEILFRDPLIVVTGEQNRWVGRRAVTLKHLIDERWCLPPPDSAAGLRCVEAFRAEGIDMPKRNVTTLSVHLQIGLLATQHYFTMCPGSLMRFNRVNRFSMKGLPIKLAGRRMPVGIVTLKNRTISPAAQLFIQTAREVARPLAKAG